MYGTNSRFPPLTNAGVIICAELTGDLSGMAAVLGCLRKLDNAEQKQDNIDYGCLVMSL
jgi:hypothetical protein